MKIVVRMFLMAALLAAGFAAGFPVGQSRGFTTGSEWALVQAGMFAREAGLEMPVSYEDGQFRITMRQPHHLYQRAWKLADRFEDLEQQNKGRSGLPETIRLARYTPTE